MKKTFALIFLGLLFSLTALADRGGDMMADQKFVKEALANVQQKGNFYFIPFPANSFFTQDLLPSGYFNERTKSAEIVLMVLDGFEKQKNLSVVAFEIQRDQKANGATAWIHGILLRAVPKK
jgi:hypothetical protein